MPEDPDQPEDHDQPVPAQHSDYAVKLADPARIAAAVIRYQTDRATFWIPVVLAVAVGVGFGLVIAGDIDGAGVGGFIAVLACIGILFYQRRRVTGSLRSGPFRPGTSVSTDFDDDGFSVTTATGVAPYPYAQIQHARLLGSVVVIRLRSHAVVALPTELVPEDRHPNLAAASGR